VKLVYLNTIESAHVNAIVLMMALVVSLPLLGVHRALCGLWKHGRQIKRVLFPYCSLRTSDMGYGVFMAETKVRELKTHCKRGHELTEENVRMRNKGNGRVARECKLCHNLLSTANRRAKSKASSKVDSEGTPVRPKATKQNILGSTAFGKDCFSHAQIMAFRRGE
jgi:hypothetical protein